VSVEFLISKVNRKGFTLIELLVVIAIIGLLATIMTVALNSARAKARDAKRIADIEQMRVALENYFADHGEYPYTVDCSSASDSGWVTSNGGTGYTPDGLVLTWTDLQTQLAPYMPKLPVTINGIPYVYGATKADWKIYVPLEQDTAKMQNDGGCYPSGPSCTGLNYEVFSEYKGTAKNWTCIQNMCAGY